MSYWLFVAIIVPAIGIAVARRYRLSPPKREMDWSLLKTFLGEESKIDRFDIADGGRIAPEVSVQLQDELDRAQYKRSRSQKGCVETLEVCRDNTFCLAVSFLNEEPVQISHAGNKNQHYPQLPPEVKADLVALLHRLRNFVDRNQRN
jgi:hypothetical protein